MRTGRLRHRIAIQQAAETQNDFGEVVKSWYNIAEVWAAIEPLSGREYLEAKQLDAALTSRIRIRHLPGVKPGMRVMWTEQSSDYDQSGTIGLLTLAGSGGRQDATLTHYYDIKAVLPDATQKREMILMCAEVL